MGAHQGRFHEKEARAAVPRPAEKPASRNRFGSLFNLFSLHRRYSLAEAKSSAFHGALFHNYRIAP
jgi:hypothetical protein